MEQDTRRIRVPRVVSVADCGRVISPRTAAIQVRGGVVRGIGAALREASKVDPRYGGFLLPAIRSSSLKADCSRCEMQASSVRSCAQGAADQRGEGFGSLSRAAVASHQRAGQRLPCADEADAAPL